MAADIEKIQRIDSLFERISSLIEQARGYVVNSMKIAEVKTRYEVGRYIYEDEQQGERAAYGEQVLKNLSLRLTERFGDDWSYDTLIRCRKFYTSYLNAQIVASPLPQLENGTQNNDIKQDINCGNAVANVYASQYSL